MNLDEVIELDRAFYCRRHPKDDPTGRFYKPENVVDFGNLTIVESGEDNYSYILVNNELTIIIHYSTYNQYYLSAEEFVEQFKLPIILTPSLY